MTGGGGQLILFYSELLETTSLLNVDFIFNVPVVYSIWGGTYGFGWGSDP
jgi:hypothetical protein